MLFSTLLIFSYISHLLSFFLFSSFFFLFLFFFLISLLSYPFSFSLSLLPIPLNPSSPFFYKQKQDNKLHSMQELFSLAITTFTFLFSFCNRNTKSFLNSYFLFSATVWTEAGHEGKTFLQGMTDSWRST